MILERFIASLEMPDWVADALCPQVDTDIFYPDKGGSTKDAKSVCMACPVREQCLEYALSHQERFGIWGGMSERERRPIVRARREGQAAA